MSCKPKLPHENSDVLLAPTSSWKFRCVSYSNFLMKNLDQLHAQTSSPMTWRLRCASNSNLHFEVAPPREVPGSPRVSPRNHHRTQTGSCKLRGCWCSFCGMLRAVCEKLEQEGRWSAASCSCDLLNMNTDTTWNSSKFSFNPKTEMSLTPKAPDRWWCVGVGCEAHLSFHEEVWVWSWCKFSCRL
jgi:hypothetical protein